MYSPIAVTVDRLTDTAAGARPRITEHPSDPA